MHNAYLYIDEFKFPIKYLEYNFRQFTGTNNKPNTRVFGGKFSFTFDIDDKKAIHLIEWMFSSTMQKNGYIKIMDFNQTSLDFKLEFANAYATSQLFHYDATSNLPLQSNVTVTAGAIRLNKDVTFLQTWNPKDPFVAQNTPIIREELEEENKKPIPSVIKVEGPFNSRGDKLEYVEKDNQYTYLATVKNLQGNSDKINWTISYDDDEIDNSYKLFSGGHIENDKLKVEIQTKKAKEKFTIYAYTEDIPHKDIFVEVNILNFPICIDRFRMPGLNNEGNDIANDLTYGKGENITKTIYPTNTIEDFKENYINGPFFTSSLSNKNDKFNKAYYTKEEIYSIDYDIKWYYHLIEVPADGLEWILSKVFDWPEEISAGAVIKYFNEHYTDEQLFAGFENLVTAYMAKGELELNIKDMIARFKKNIGGVYRSNILNKAIENHPSTLQYCKEVEDYIAEKLKNSNGKLSKLIENEIDFNTDEGRRDRRAKGKTTTRKSKGKEIFFMRPQFNSFNDLIEGQRIALNDIWATNVEITEYKIEGEEYQIKYDVTLWDHFGLDLPDMEKYFNLIGRARAIFASWFTLQHLRGYKPFITHIQFSKEFTGKLNEGKYEGNK